MGHPRLTQGHLRGHPRPPFGSPKVTHCVGWTRGTVPRRSTAGPRELWIFLIDEIFSRSNLLIRLKPAGQSGGHEIWHLGQVTVPRQDTELILECQGILKRVFPYL